MRRLLVPVILMALVSARMGGQARQEETVDTLLARAASWLETLEQDFAVVIADETYSQQIGERRYPDAPRENFRKLQSELGFLWVPDELMWVAARNVRTVDGMPIGGGNKRLQDIMEEANLRLAFLRGLRGESAKFNIGSVYRNFNDPTFALQYLDRRSQRRFGWVRRSGERIRGVDTVKLDFTEAAQPYFIRAAGYDLPSSGSAWVERATGTVYRTHLEVWDSRGRVRGRIDVDLARDAKLGLVVPVQMNEEYTAYPATGTSVVDLRSGLTIFGTAEYSNFRRFETTGRLITPN